MSLFVNSQHDDREMSMKFDFDEEKISYINKIAKMVASSPELQEKLKKIWIIKPDSKASKEEIKKINERALEAGLEDKKTHTKNLL